MSNFHKCVYLTWFIWWLWCGMNRHEERKNKSDLLVNLFPPTVLLRGRCQVWLLLFSEISGRLRSRLQVVAPLLRWLSASAAGSLWNRSSAADGDSFRSPAQPKYQTMCPNGKCRHKLKKPLQRRVSCLPASIYYTNMATECHNKERQATTEGLRTQIT